MNNLGPYPKLSDWEIREIQARADAIDSAYPRLRRGWGRKDYRYRQFVRLASTYGINVRTLYRYLRRVA